MGSTGPILAVGGITLFNETIVHGRPVDWRIPVGTGIAAAGLALVGQWSPGVARGLALVALVTILFARVKPDVPSPVESFLAWSRIGER
jgi:hypothetical protein